MYVGKSERTKGVTWGGGGEESWIDVSQKEIIALLFLFIFLSLTHSSGSCSLCPILSGVRPPDLVTLTERSKTWGGENDKRRQEVGWEERKKKLGSTTPLFPPSLSFPLRLTLTGTNNYSFLCHRLKQSTPLSRLLSSCICGCARLCRL